jgi:hypothetical protein
MRQVRDFIEKYKKKCVILCEEMPDFIKLLYKNSCLCLLNFLQLLRVLRRMKNIHDFIEKYKKTCVILCVD